MYLIYENETNEHLSLSIAARFQKDSQSSEILLMDIDLVYEDQTIE